MSDDPIHIISTNQDGSDQSNEATEGEASADDPQNILNEALHQSEEKTKLNKSLHYAMGKSVEDVSKLISEGAEVNSLVDISGIGVYNTPLSVAVDRGNLEMAKLLLEHRADPNQLAEIHKGNKKNNMTVLFRAARDGNTEMVNLLLEYGAKADHQVYFGCCYESPLAVAAEGKHLEVMTVLLDHGSDPNYYFNDTAVLIEVSYRGDIEVARLLLKYNADPNIRRSDVCYHNPLFSALNGGHIELMKVLLEFKADPNCIDFLGESLLNRAVENGNNEIVQLLLTHNANPNFGKTALCKSVEKEQIEVMKTLVDYGVDPNLTSETFNETALHLASRLGKSEMVDILLKLKADPSITNDRSEVPLYIAVEKGNIGVVDVMISHGVSLDLGYETKYRKAPLIAAVCNRNLELMTVLLKNNANPNIKDLHDHTLLVYAYKEMKHHHAEMIEVMKLLLEFKADPDIRFGYNGLVVLHVASEDGDTEVVKLLLENNANPSIISTDQHLKETPLSLAANKGHIDVLKLLLAHGADPNVTEVYKTPLYKASEKDDMEAVEVLLKHGADPNISCGKLRSPFYIASRCGNNKVVEMFLDHGAKLDDWYALCIASKKGHIAVLEVMFKHNVDPNLPNPGNLSTALHFASSVDIAEYLVNHGADIHALLKVQNSVLHTACKFAIIDTIEYFIKKGISLEARNEDGRTPVDMLLFNEDTDIQDRKKCLAMLKDKGYYKEHEAPIADLSTEISSDSPSIDKMDYGLSLDVDPSSLSNGSPVLADIKVYTENEVSTLFTFPEETKPVSAVYTISLRSDTEVLPRTLRIQHCADPSNPEELEHLTFVKSINDSSNELEVVPGGVFRVGQQYGEITPPHMCSWSIVGNIKKLRLFEKTRYVCWVLYRTVKQYPGRWLMELIVGQHDPTTKIELEKHIKSRTCDPEFQKPRFSFTFKDCEIPKLNLVTDGQDSSVLKCDNGWEIAFESSQISQCTADGFRKFSSDEPGMCSLIIHTHKTVCHELLKLPTVSLNGIVSDTEFIRINPPVLDEYEPDHTNTKPELRNYERSRPTGPAVFDLMKCHSAIWDTFARELKVDRNYRQIVYMDINPSAEVRLERIIYHWIESECSPVTWDNLINVFKRMKLQNVVEVIEAVHPDYANTPAGGPPLTDQCDTSVPDPITSGPPPLTDHTESAPCISNTRVQSSQQINGSTRRENRRFGFWCCCVKEND